MGPGAPSVDTPCGSIGGSARYVVGVCGFNSEAGSARYQPQGRQSGPLRGLSRFSSSCLPPTRFRCPPRSIAGSSPRFPRLWWCALCQRLPPARAAWRSRAGAASTKNPGGPEAKTSGPKGRAGPPGRRPPAPKPRSGRRGGDPAGPREAQRGGRHEARATAAQRRKPAAKGGRPQAQRGQRVPAEPRSGAQGPSEGAGGERRGPAPATEAQRREGAKRRTGAAKRGPGGPRRSGRAQGQGPRRKSGREVRKKRRGPRRRRGSEGRAAPKQARIPLRVWALSAHRGRVAPRHFAGGPGPGPAPAHLRRVGPEGPTIRRPSGGVWPRQGPQLPPVCGRPLILDTRTLFRHDPVTNYVHDWSFILRRRSADYC